MGLNNKIIPTYTQNIFKWNRMIAQVLSLSCENTLNIVLIMKTVFFIIHQPQITLRNNLWIELYTQTWKIYNKSVILVCNLKEMK